MRRAGGMFTPLVVSTLTIGLVTGCVTHTTAAVPDHRHGSPVRAAATASGGFNTTDTAWLQLMIPMNERVLPLLDLGAERGHDPAVRRLAARARNDHLTELERLRVMLTRTGLPPTNVHAGHDMPGMVTAADLTALRATGGAAFDRLFLDRLREHLQQSAMVSRSEQTAGADDDTRALAAAVERSRGAQLDLLGRVRAAM
ncbi:DUF305 domain-containing protein [Streptosporangium sp. CA-135522]|uniref:DUF305 domain-containing protein n=1 Tax=Streptosporangium sp. CA-135522 TaxID=3240072 RepID=UPI003D8C666F